MHMPTFLGAIPGIWRFIIQVAVTDIQGAGRDLSPIAFPETDSGVSGAATG